jgi:pantetheine-phosphate adenylyltransferase
MTLGHLDIVARAAALFDEVVVATGVNVSKNRLFTPEERLEMLRDVCTPYANVRVTGFTGLLTDFCRAEGIQAIVKGLRAGSDFEYELQMAQMNASLEPGLETVFVPTAPAYSFLASSLVKEVAAYGGDVSGFVPPEVHGRLVARLAERRTSGEG